LQKCWKLDKKKVRKALKPRPGLGQSWQQPNPLSPARGEGWGEGWLLSLIISPLTLTFSPQGERGNIQRYFYLLNNEMEISLAFFPAY
jgi:hypothetical protein